jgi:hypothetical protein
MQEARPVAVEAGDRYTEADTLVIEAMATTYLGPRTARSSSPGRRSDRP